MDHLQQNVKRKWERHYRETTSTIAAAIILLGFCISFALIYLYPQIFAKEMFEARLSYHLILDADDYLTCDKDYINFIIDEPTLDSALTTFYVFHVQNPGEVFERGYKPNVVEVGPFGFRKLVYKYDVDFEESYSLTVTFKEYSILQEINDPIICERMYFRMERAYADLINPCLNGKCECTSIEKVLTIVNPTFLKLIWEDSPHDFLAHLSADVFSVILDLLENDFVEAVRSHLVNKAFNEIYFFRAYLQSANEMNTAFHNLNQIYSAETIAYMVDTGDTSVNTWPATCGLEIYGITTCPFSSFYSDLQYNYDKLKGKGELLDSYDRSRIPSVLGLFNESSPYSFLNAEYGMGKWIGIGFYLGFIEYNGQTGFTMVSTAEFVELYQDMLNFIMYTKYNESEIDDNSIKGATVLVSSICFYLFNSWLDPFGTVHKDATYKEFQFTYEPVTCTPLGVKCVWQMGYMTKYHNSIQVSNEMTFSLIDLTSALNTNPNNIYYAANLAGYYNNYDYCQNIYFAKKTEEELLCMKKEFTYDDGRINKAAGLWGVDYGVEATNLTNLYYNYKTESETIQNDYFFYACNVSYLLFKIYRENTEFHDNYVVKYLNNNRDPNFNFKFTVGNWKEIGWAQFGGGYVTFAMLNVRSIYQIVRNGMWNFGPDNYYRNLLEYASWCLKEGFIQGFIPSVADSKTLLYALARKDHIGFAFRRHIVYTSTTLVGNGNNMVNGVGKVGEIVFTPTSNFADFSCNDNTKPDYYIENTAPCRILNKIYISDASFCDDIDRLFSLCISEVFKGNAFITNCERFETTMTSPVSGIQCDHSFVTKQPHPYTKISGNILYEMLFSLAITLTLKTGQWCINPLACDYSMGGMFSTTSVKKILFEGYTEPSVLKYLNLKHDMQKIHFRCVDYSAEICGVELYTCNDAGINLQLPNGTEKLFKYGVTQHDEYFAPYFEVVSNSEMLWRNSMDPTVRQYAKNVANSIQNNNSTNLTITKVFNPFWTAYPAWNSDDVIWNKYYQCQKRMFGGLPETFVSCLDTLNTGKEDVKEALNIEKFMGNSSIYFFDEPVSVRGSTMRNQHRMYQWLAFISFPYVFQGNVEGPGHLEEKKITIFNKQYSFMLDLSQDDFIFDFEMEIPITFPLQDSWSPRERNETKTLTIGTRRFAETGDSWEPLRNANTPKDSYGMDYIVPIGMLSLERWGNFPIFLSTPHNYGNRDWGGQEWSHVSGTIMNFQKQRTFVDYDGVTGIGIRNAFRHQVNLRVEKGPTFLNVFSSQDRCVSPTKSYSLQQGGLFSGYGCFAYVPLLWSEDAKVIEIEDFFRKYDHFYSRPDRFAFVLTIGSVIGPMLIILGSILCLSEAHHRKRFNARVYVD